MQMSFPGLLCLLIHSKWPIITFINKNYMHSNQLSCSSRQGYSRTVNDWYLLTLVKRCEFLHVHSNWDKLIVFYLNKNVTKAHLKKAHSRTHNSCLRIECMRIKAAGRYDFGVGQSDFVHGNVVLLYSVNHVCNVGVASFLINYGLNHTC